MLLAFAKYTLIHIMWNIPEDISSSCEHACETLKSTTENSYFLEFTFISSFSIHNTRLREFMELGVMINPILSYLIYLSSDYEPLDSF